MGLTKKIIGMSLGVALSVFVIKHDYSLYQKIQRVEQSIEWIQNAFHGVSSSMVSSSMRKQYNERMDSL